MDVLERLRRIAHLASLVPSDQAPESILGKIAAEARASIREIEDGFNVLETVAEVAAPSIRQYSDFKGLTQMLRDSPKHALMFRAPAAQRCHHCDLDALDHLFIGCSTFEPRDTQPDGTGYSSEEKK